MKKTSKFIGREKINLVHFQTKLLNFENNNSFISASSCVSVCTKRCKKEEKDFDFLISGDVGSQIPIKVIPLRSTEKISTFQNEKKMWK
jgi:hypothetical protein